MVRKLGVMAIAFAMTGMSVAGELSADFGNVTGKIRPALHSSGFGPTICSQTAQDLADVKAMGFKYARTHDWALVNPNDRVCDWHHIFPLQHLDATDPKNYVFAPTDYLLKRTREEAGIDIFFRLGTSIEHSGDKIHFNSRIPEDFDKVAEVFAGTVRHYNRGWANGHHWDIKYWEIWNEPDGVNNMWCLPEGDEPWLAVTDEDKRKSERRQALFTEFFVKCLKRMKGEFGDTIKVGGPAMCGWKGSPEHAQRDYFARILGACKKEGLAPDFISWHHYANDPMTLNNSAADARALCDSFGFTKCELIVNEWHYFGSTYSWEDMQRSSDPEAKARIFEGPDSHHGIRSSCFTLSTLANIQRSKLDQAYFYGCSHTGSWGFKDFHQNKYKLFYALKMFGDLVKAYPEMCASESAGTVTLLAVCNPSGRKGLLVSDYGGAGRGISIDIKGVAPDAKVTCTLLDNRHDLTPHTATLKDGRLSLMKPDFYSAAFFVEFEE